MSTSTVITTPAHSMEYVLLVEGTGWLVDETAENPTAGGIEGHVFVTHDFNGTLATDLASTGHTNLLSSNVATGTDTAETTTGFTAIDSASIQSSAIISWMGRKALRVSPVNTISGVKGGVKTDATAVVAASTTYTASFYIMHLTTGSTYTVDAYLYDNVNAVAGTTVSTTMAAWGGAFTLAGVTWTRVTCSVTTGAGSPTLSLFILENVESVSRRVFWIDGLQIQSGSTASPWVNGSLRVATCTIHKGLLLPQSVSDKMDPLTFEYSVGGMDFSIVDYDEYVLDNITPNRTPGETTVSTAINVADDDLIFTSGTNFATGAKAWIGGRELVLLGTKSGVGPHTYTDSIRGYLGTPIGKHVAGFPGSTAGLQWEAGTIVQSSNKFLWNKRVRLYAHVPGDKAEDMMLIYSGRLKGMKSDAGGTQWNFESAGEQLNTLTRIKSGVPCWSFIMKDFLIPSPSGNLWDVYAATPSTGLSPSQVMTSRIAGVLNPAISGTATQGGIGSSNPNRFLVLGMYQYRTEPGGTAGAKAAIFTTTPQAIEFNAIPRAAESYIQSKDRLMRVTKHRTGYTGLNVLTDPNNLYGDDWAAYETPMKTRFLLDNVTDEHKLSRFATNRMVHRNPITTLLMFLTSMHDESLLFDAISAGSSVSRIVAPDNVLSTTDRWRGYALHSVEGTDNKGYAREIIGNSAGVGNYINIARGFPAIPTGTTEEFQIRNSIYDVLPLGWGLAVHNNKINIKQFEYVRDKFLADANLGKFIIGTNDRIDILDAILTNIAQAYNVLVFIGRDGRVTCEYMGEALGDGIITDYVTVQKRDIIGDVSDLQFHIEKPIGSVQIQVRAVAASVTGMIKKPSYANLDGTMQDNNIYTSSLVQMPDLEGETITLDVRSSELVAAYGEGVMDSISVGAMLNSAEDCEHLVVLAQQRLKKYTQAPPTISFRVGLHLFEDIHAGSYLSITHDSLIDPYDGANGISSRVGRVLSTEVMLSQSDPGVEMEVELLSNIAGAKIAPACEVTAKGSDANGQYLTCSATAYTADPDNTWDHMGFKLADLVELRSITGTLKEVLGTITGFGNDFDDSPEKATYSAMPPTSVRIYVSDASITSTIASGDYITFAPWSGSNTTNMSTHAAYATDGGALTGGSTAKEYG